MPGSARVSRRPRPASTRSGRRPAGSTPRSGTATWCAPALQWRRTLRSDGRMGGWADGPRWNLIVDAVGRSGEYNMAMDEALLEEVACHGSAYLRFYRWDPPMLSLGRNQPNTFSDLPTVRRLTGGQAVWHEHEVTYAVVAPIVLFESLRKAYGEIHTRLARALRALSVEAVLAPAHPPIRPSAHPASCFASSVGGEILVDGRKLV